MSDKTFVLIDGENLIIRFQDMVSLGWTPVAGVIHEQDQFVWFRKAIYWSSQEIFRVGYYTTFVGADDELEAFRKRISETPFISTVPHKVDTHGTLNPHVFKKSKKGKGTKSVDINMCVDALRHSADPNVSSIMLFTGDGDYIPLIEELMRRGVHVTVRAFSEGCNPKLRYIADDFLELDSQFFSHVPKNAE